MVIDSITLRCGIDKVYINNPLHKVEFYTTDAKQITFTLQSAVRHTALMSVDLKQCASEEIQQGFILNVNSYHREENYRHVRTFRLHGSICGYTLS